MRLFWRSCAVLVWLPALWLFAWKLWLAGVAMSLLAGMLWTGRLRYGAALLGAAPLVVPWSLYRYSIRVDALTDAVVQGGPTALSVADCVAIYGLNLLMAVVGFFLGFPEVAYETASLAWPNDGEMELHDAYFPRCVPKVGAAVALRQELARDGAWRFMDERLAWNYGAPGSSWRGALALTPSTLATTRSGETLQFRVTVPVNYPERYRLVMGKAGPFTIGVEEGLFHALEELGWLHPYRLTYRFDVELDESELPPCEAWIVRLLQ